MKKLLPLLTLCLLCACCAFGFAACDNCGGNNNHTHVNDNIVITKQPTCIEEGEITVYCTCGLTYTSNIPMIEHNFNKSGEPYGGCALNMMQNYACTYCDKMETRQIYAQAPDTHNRLSIGEICPHCDWTVYNKNGDSVLMKNSEDKLSAEFYGYNIFDFGESIKQYYVNVYISDNVTTISYEKFANCSNLTSVTIGDSVISIGYFAFKNCSSLTSLTLPNKLESIVTGAFYGCESLTDMIIPYNTKSIGSVAFEGCNNLIEIEGGLLYVQKILIGVEKTNDLPQTYYSIRKGTKIIADDALSNKSNIVKIDIPDSVISIGEGALRWCSSLMSINVDENNKKYKSIDGNLYSKDGKSLIQYAIGKTATEFTIPDGVTSIEQGAFWDCSNLTNIHIGNSIKNIGNHAFYNCRNLKLITLPDSLKYIGYYAFYNCSSLERITIPDNLTRIEGYAFENCSNLTSVTIGNSVTSIGFHAFEDCRNLTSIIIPDSVTSIENNAFYNCNGLTNITFSGTKAQWKAISKETSWKYDVPSSCKVHCTDGDINI